LQRQVSLGQNIVSAASGASSPVFMIGDVSKVWMVANAREETASALHKGDHVEVSVYANPSKIYQAKLIYVAASIDPNTHRLPVRAEIDNTDDTLKPEMMARFRILTGESARNPGIPDSAVVYEGETAHVWVADETDKKLQLRDIKIGRSYDGFVEATDGIKAGEKIVTSGAVFIDRAVSGD
jgi:cobalt-zinc-cadmium efflux system membrane fusion protein